MNGGVKHNNTMELYKKNASEIDSLHIVVPRFFDLNDTEKRHENARSTIKAGEVQELAMIYIVQEKYPWTESEGLIKMHISAMPFSISSNSMKASAKPFQATMSEYDP